jgi:hypothetical protein
MTMETIIVHPQNEVQQKALQIILDGFEIPYEQEPITDETECILANPVMTKRLNESIKNIEQGNITIKRIEDLWK